ncbi:hypothetical protein OZD61_05720 [Wolbachia endosymbiont of Drosophila bocki]|nr:hypothetical protein [Wolbachia endosymbiont of Drosophila bocki]
MSFPSFPSYYEDFKQVLRQLPLAHQLSYKQNFWIPDWNDIICCAIYLQK